MDHLQRPVYDKIQDMVSKLQKMDCSLLGNKDDAWIMELFFQAGFHRYHLIEWILSKLNYNIKEMSGPRNSEDERFKILQTALIDLGICRENSHDILKGVAKMDEQLEFWCLMVNILWTKYEITSNVSLSDSDEVFPLSDGISLSEKSRKLVYEEYENAAYCIDNILDTVDLQNLLKTDLDILTPDVEREIKNMSTLETGGSMPASTVNVSDASKNVQGANPTMSFASFVREKTLSLQQLKELAKKSSSSNFYDVYNTVQAQSPMQVTDFSDDMASEDEINQLENAVLEKCTLVQDYFQGKFTETYNELKPLILHAKAEEFTDVGSHFQKIEGNLEKFLELKKSLVKLSSSYSKIEKVTSELKNLSSKEQSNGSQSINIANLLKDA